MIVKKHKELKIMRLMEILKEVQLLESIEGNDKQLIDIIKENYKSSDDKSFNIKEILAEAEDEGLSIQAAKTAIKKLETTAKEKFAKIKSTLISGFMTGDIAPVKKLLAAKANTKLAVDYLNLLKAAHGGETKLLSKSEGQGKTFFKKVFGLIDDVAEPA